MVIRCGFLVALLGCGAKTELPCSRDGEACPDEEDRADECSVPLAPAPPCQGIGLIWTSTDDCIDDGGQSDTGDLLEVYCIDSVARFCLSHEACPWRDTPAHDDRTCSHAGLRSSYMANSIRGCTLWDGHALYCCSAEERIGIR